MKRNFYWIATKRQRWYLLHLFTAHCLVLPWAPQSCLSMLVLTIIKPREIVLAGLLIYSPLIFILICLSGKRTFLNKLARISGFYRLFLHKIKPIDESLFILLKQNLNISKWQKISRNVFVISFHNPVSCFQLSYVPSIEMIS